MIQLAVIGNPLNHSLSPMIHNLFAQQAGIDIHYSKIESPVHLFKESVDDFFNSGGLGLSVTAPFKQAALKISDSCQLYAQIAQSSNSLSLIDNKIVADNTDGQGFIQDLTFNLDFQLEKKKILLLGAGGAARGLILPLLQSNISHLHIANRTIDNARLLSLTAQKYQKSTFISYSIFEDIKDKFDVIIHATSANLHGDTVHIPVCWHEKTFIYDLMYSQGKTAFIEQMTNHHLPMSDGLGMLIEQAALSFRSWTGFNPDTQSIFQYLKSTI